MANTLPIASSPYALVGFARPKPERMEELRELLLSFVAPTRTFWDNRMDYLEQDLEIRWLNMRSPYPR